MEKVKHKHLLIRAEVNKPPENEDEIKEWLQYLISKIDMKILAGPYASKVDKPVGNAGLTGVAIIETSHVVIHTWDEKNPALVQLDVYSCKDFKKHTVVECLEDFEPVQIDYKYFDRENNFKEIDNEHKENEQDKK
jgi:S-adenosylmethionine/arginine decarboxylase-like enzyme